jgi:hypothetical protein
MAATRSFMGIYTLDENENPVEVENIYDFEPFGWPQIVTEERGFTVSTVFLGIDHNMTGEGSPVLWETMVFDENRNGVFQERYTSADQARRGHEQIVTALQQGADPTKL